MCLELNLVQLCTSGQDRACFIFKMSSVVNITVGTVDRLTLVCELGG